MDKEVMLASLARIQREAAEKKGLYLHLGCGKNIFENFVNVDMYFPDMRCKPWDIGKIPLPENSVDLIYSSHSLEHLNIRNGIRALQNWHKILRPDGMLYLAVPDLKAICYKMATDTAPNIQSWWIYTLFGYQAHPDSKPLDREAPNDLGQYHMSGYTEETLRHELSLIGYKIKTMFTYDGWGTPSIWVEASK